jgi:hypothetical protein
MSPVLAFHVHRNEGVRGRYQEKYVEDQPQYRAKHAQNEVENRSEGLPVQQKAERGQHRRKEVDHGPISGARIRVTQDLGDLAGSAIA